MELIRFGKSHPDYYRSVITYKPFPSLQDFRKPPFILFRRVEVGWRLVLSSVAYFEVNILNVPAFQNTTSFSWGVSSRRFPYTNAQLGHVADSFGCNESFQYACCFDQDMRQGAVAPTENLTNSSIVGCGIIYHESTYEIFFTHNGRVVHSDHPFIFYTSSPLYPTITTNGCVEVELNCGNMPFLYSVEEWDTPIDPSYQLPANQKNHKMSLWAHHDLYRHRSIR